MWPSSCLIKYGFLRNIASHVLLVVITLPIVNAPAMGNLEAVALAEEQAAWVRA